MRFMAEAAGPLSTASCIGGLAVSHFQTTAEVFSCAKGDSMCQIQTICDSDLNLTNKVRSRGGKGRVASHIMRICGFVNSSRVQVGPEESLKEAPTKHFQKTITL